MRHRISVYTLGYQGLTLSDYIAILHRAGVGVVLDVRENAFSYKPGFSKTQFQAGLANEEIEYKHIRSAGNPSANRKSATSIAECLARYHEHLRANSACLDELSHLIKEAWLRKVSVCLTCYEHLPTECHRTILLDELISRDSLFEARPLPFVLESYEKPVSTKLGVPKGGDNKTARMMSEIAKKKAQIMLF